MSQEDIYEEAQRVAIEANEMEPTMETWGFEAYGDAPGGIGGGVGGFVWFNSKEELFDFAGRLLTFFAPGPVSLDHDEVARNAAAVVSRVQDGELGMDEGMEALNSVLVRFSQLRWWGQFKDLVSGNRPFEKELRAWSRVSDDDEEDTSPIANDELDAFKASLQEWGI